MKKKNPQQDCQCVCICHDVTDFPTCKLCRNTDCQPKEECEHENYKVIMDGSVPKCTKCGEELGCDNGTCKIPYCITCYPKKHMWYDHPHNTDKKGKIICQPKATKEVAGEIGQWEEDFSKFYGAMFECGDFDELMDKIRNLLKDQGTKVREEERQRAAGIVEEMKSECKPHHANKADGCSCRSYNAILDEILDKLITLLPEND